MIVIVLIFLCNQIIWILVRMIVTGEFRDNKIKFSNGNILSMMEIVRNNKKKIAREKGWREKFIIKLHGLLDLVEVLKNEEN